MSDVEQRIVALESLAMHLQHDFEQLNAVVLEQRDELASLRADVQRLQRMLIALRGGDSGHGFGKRSP